MQKKWFKLGQTYRQCQEPIQEKIREQEILRMKLVVVV